MSKYIDLELALNELLRLYEEDVDAFGVEIPETFDYHRAKETLLNLPTIEVSEDCISRKWLEKYKEDITYRDEWYDIRRDELVSWRDIENAPSVVPSRAEGEWVVRANGNNECSICGREKQYGWVNFCGFCGAKMKG